MDNMSMSQSNSNRLGSIPTLGFNPELGVDKPASNGIKLEKMTASQELDFAKQYGVELTPQEKQIGRASCRERV